jgi:hypothetical protein
MTNKLVVIINSLKYQKLSTRKTIQPTYINTRDELFEQVNAFKYLGTMVNTNNSTEEEIKERIAAGNRAYHVHKKTIHIQINIPKRQTTTL